MTEVVERPGVPVRPSTRPVPVLGDLRDHPTHPGVLPARERPGGPWAPWSPCGDECLPPRPRAGWLRASRRLCALACVVASAVVAGFVLPLLRPAGRDRLLRALLGGALRAAGVRLEVTGSDTLRPDDGRGALVVANHLSWIDVLALGAVSPVRMLAKREVAQWPVIGTLAGKVGTLFVDREGLSTLPGVVDDTAAALRDGALIGVFPEATTWCGAASGEFRRAPFQAAIDAGAPVRPVTFALRTADGRPTTAASFVGDQTLGDSLLRVLRMPSVVCAMTISPVLEPTGDRRSLARRAEAVVRSA
ncbi:1-acyl-sn-glycerol-3-phosphate acyltransferase [Pseudonocardia sediminis]|uniref:1-acyl-sn-glycerol-3-phosphate acyltransferase n=1 Tax=Pseudonocardia sediminis TaxID=1397368 RepID=A0A4Q7V1J7_PSEST|nr:lysophospholipid acyltransferase family protein [Pseudonocardia sediminis]RZT87995.1 1-acyl-sn-glycerol-3-phosphate acyltransferase [Pseudonocardia sediminis]